MHKRHKSTKVPNVKLRPKPPLSELQSHAKRGRYAAAAADDDDGEGEFRARMEQRLARGGGEEGDEVEGEGAEGEGAEGEGEGEGEGRPLQGYCFCFTGIEKDKPELYEIASSLGALVEGNLTDSVTHLIARTSGSQKYQCALQLGIYILRPDFLRALKSAWVHARPLRIPALLAEHALRPLDGLVVGICGVEETKRKDVLKARLAHLGATIRFPMTFDTGVTHLVCGTTRRSQSTTLATVHRLRGGFVGTAQERAGAKALHCVSLDWVDDCEAVGGRIPEEHYDVFAPAAAPSSVVGGRSPARRSAAAAATGSLSPAARAGIRASFPSRDAEAAAQRAREQRAENFAFFEEMDRQEKERRREQAKVKGTAGGDGGGGDVDAGKILRRSLHGMGASTSRAVETPERGEPAAKGSSKSGGSALLNIGRKVTISGGSGGGGSKSHTSPPAAPAPPSRPRTLKGTTIRLDLAPPDAAKASPLRNALLKEGATVLEALDQRTQAEFCITSLGGPWAVRGRGTAPHDWRTMDLPEWYGRPVTPLWLEQCLWYERLVGAGAGAGAGQGDFAEAEDAPYLEPASVPLPRAAAETTSTSTTSPLPPRCVVALTGFPPRGDSPHRLQLEKVLTALGCTVTESLNRRENTHLLSAHYEAVKDEMDGAALLARGLKKEGKARQWGIHVVGMPWVASMWRGGDASPEDTRAAVQQGSEEKHQLRAGDVSVLGETQAHDEPVRRSNTATSDSTLTSMSTLTSVPPSSSSSTSDSTAATAVTTSASGKGTKPSVSVTSKPGPPSSEGDVPPAPLPLPPPAPAPASASERRTARDITNRRDSSSSSSSASTPGEPEAQAEVQADAGVGAGAGPAKQPSPPPPQPQAQPPPQHPPAMTQDSLAGQSMWASRMEGHVVALLAAARPARSRERERERGRQRGRGSAGAGAGPVDGGDQGPASAAGAGAGVTEQLDVLSGSKPTATTSTARGPTPDGGPPAPAPPAPRHAKPPPKSHVLRRERGQSRASRAGSASASVSPLKGTGTGEGEGAGESPEGKAKARSGRGGSGSAGAGAGAAGREGEAHLELGLDLDAEMRGARSHSASVEMGMDLPAAHEALKALKHEGEGDALADPAALAEPAADESFKVTYRDPAAERERRRIAELLEGRGGGAGKAGGKGK